MTTTPPPPTSQPEPGEPPKRKWYTKKRHIAWMALVVLVVAIAASGSPPEPERAEPAPAQAEPASDADDQAAQTDADMGEVGIDPAIVDYCATADDPAACEEHWIDSGELPEPGTDAAGEVAAAEAELEEAIEAAEEQADKTRKENYEDLTAREFSKVVRDPDAHAGDQVIVFGEVFQFDSLTGTEQFLAFVDGDRDTEGEEFGYVSYEHTALMVDDCFCFEDVVEGDLIKAWVTVQGPFDYDTQIGGSTTATMFTVEHIKVLPALEG